MRVSYYEFCKTIAEDFGIELNKTYKTRFEEFPAKNGQRKINGSHDAIIVDRQGNEHPYMISPSMRNNEKLNDFEYIYVVRMKSLLQIIEEIGINLKSQPCKICEGNGWHSNGTEYFYKEISCVI